MVTSGPIGHPGTIPPPLQYHDRSVVLRLLEGLGLSPNESEEVLSRAEEDGLSTSFERELGVLAIQSLGWADPSSYVP